MSIQRGKDADYTPEGLATDRPLSPTYIFGDENVMPDRIIIVDAPSTAGYSLEDGGENYIAGTKLTYRCWRNFKAGDRNRWKIEMVNESPITTDGFQQTVHSTYYPYGCAGYNFNPDDIRYYAYGVKY